MASFVQPDGRTHAILVACHRADDDRWLLIRRAADGPMPGRVSFPSGGVQSGESQPQTIVRKMRDELGVDVEPVRCCWRWDDDRADERLTLFGWRACIVAGALRPDPTQVAEILWLTLAQAAGHPDAFPTLAAFAATLER